MTSGFGDGARPSAATGGDAVNTDATAPRDAGPEGPPASPASDPDEAEGRVYTVIGQDWDEIVAAANETGDSASEERIVVNMGPQHPSTHGVLRVILTLDGETVTELRLVIGYLHTGIEKNMEVRTWTQGVTFCTRMDYLTPTVQRDRLLSRRGAAARHRGADPGPGAHHQGADDGAEPDLITPGGNRPIRAGTGRDDRVHAKYPRTRDCARRLRADHRAAHEPRLRPAGRRLAGCPTRRSRRDT